ncbi:MAG: hypothetical protein LBM93_16000 [Oscillospiraceae bacterium]|jgi:hypothetical protein|nr:hypothetical protein [Oscillospiraceae bacterium]
MKHRILSFLTAVMFLFSVVPVGAAEVVSEISEESGKCGDLNDDGIAGKIDDIVTLAKYLSGRLKLSEKTLKLANCDDKDMLINTADLTALINYTLGIYKFLPVGANTSGITTTSTTVSTTTTSIKFSTSEPTTTFLETTTTSTTIVSTPESTTTSTTVVSTPEPTTTSTTISTPEPTTTSTTVSTPEPTTTTTITTTISTTTTVISTTEPIVTTTVFEPQVPIYQYIYGDWLGTSLDMIKDRVGLTVNKDMTVPIYIADIDASNVVAQCGVSSTDFTQYVRPANRFTIQLNSYYFQYDSVIDNPDAYIDSIATPADSIFAHELVHGIMYVNFAYNVLSYLPDWYSEGMAEAVTGNNRFVDFPPQGGYYYNYKGTSAQIFSDVSNWEIAQVMIGDFTYDITGIYSYYVGYLFMNWLDNYGKENGSGQYTSTNGGQVKVLNANIAKQIRTNGFSIAIQNTYGKSIETLIEEFKAEAADITIYDEWANWVNDKMNIQCNDGLYDALSNTDSVDMVENTGEPALISKTNIYSYNGYDLTIDWSF